MIERLLEVYEKLGPVERKVLCTLANRLYAGQRKYGPLQPGKKVWTWEAFEEAIDQNVYLTCGLLDATAESQRRYRSEVEDPVNHTVQADQKLNPQFYGNIAGDVAEFE